MSRSRLSQSSVMALALMACIALAGPVRAQSSGCGSDSDCKGERICEDGQCVDPPATTPCGADVDCPGDEICVEGSCVDEGASTTSSPPSYEDDDRYYTTGSASDLDLDIARDRVGDARRRRGMSRFLTVFGMSIQTAGAVAAAPFWQLGAAINAGGMLFYGLGAVGYGDSLRRSNDGYELLGTDDYNSATLRKGHVFTGLNFAAQGLAMFVAAIPYMVEGDPWYYFEEGTSVPMGLLAGTISLVPTLLSFIWVDMAITEALEGLRDETRAQRVSSCPRIQIAPSLIITDEQSTLGVVGVW